MSNYNETIECKESDYDARDILEPLYEEAREVKQRVLFPIDQAKEVIDEIIETCESENKRFYDYFFPPSSKSINRYPIGYLKESETVSNFKWNRFSDVHEDPKLFVNQISPTDIDQGGIGNCYMIAAISSFAQRSDLVKEAFYPNEWNSAGIFGIKIWIESIQEWRMVIVDDYLPFNNEVDSLIFAGNKTKNEAWASLLEKAFAKMNGCYLALQAGSCLTEPIPAMTGQSIYYLETNSPNEIFEAIQYYCSNGGIVQSSGGTILQDGSYVNAKEEEGLVQGHAYSVLGTMEMDGFRLIKLRNPWGNFEWNGDWGDNSNLWNEYPEIAEACKHKKSDNGIFWMTIEDFCNKMESPTVTAIEFDHLPNLDKSGREWALDRFYKEYRDDLEELTCIRFKDNDESNTGESNLETFPQYALEVTETIEFMAITQRINDGAAGFSFAYVFANEEDAERVTEYNRISEQEYIIEIKEEFNTFELEPGSYTFVLFTNNEANEESILKIWSTEQLEFVEIPASE